MIRKVQNRPRLRSFLYHFCRLAKTNSGEIYQVCIGNWAGARSTVERKVSGSVFNAYKKSELVTRGSFMLINNSS